MDPSSRIFIPGHRGLVGTTLLKKLLTLKYQSLILRSRHELDLISQSEVTAFFEKERPEYIFLCAAKVGGIQANMSYPADFIFENLMIQNNIIHLSARYGVKRLLFLGSSCIYPKMAPQPIKESYLLTDSLEPTNAPYAIAKIAGIMMCGSYNRQYGTRFFSVMPTNLYGPNDHFDLETSHVIPALIRKFHIAKLADEKKFDAIADDEAIFGKIPDDLRNDFLGDQASHTKRPSVRIWGSGTPMREFLYVDDLADALIFLMQQKEGTLFPDGPQSFLPGSPDSILFNVGAGREISIGRLAHLIRQIVGFQGEIIFDRNKPDGSPKKLLDTTKLLSLGWKPGTSLSDGIKQTYRWYLQISEDPFKKRERRAQ